MFAESSTEQCTDNDLGIFSVQGVVDLPAAGRVMALNDGWAQRHKIAAQVVNYQGAAIAIPAEVLFGVAAGIVRGSAHGGLLTPTALLVRADRLDDWRQYCWLMAQAGVMRQVFTDYGRARAWAEDQAALRAAQALHLKTAQSRR